MTQFSLYFNYRWRLCICDTVSTCVFSDLTVLLDQGLVLTQKRWISKCDLMIKEVSVILILLTSQPSTVKAISCKAALGKSTTYLLSSDSPFIFFLMPVDREQFVL